MTKITESIRLRKGLDMIEDLAECYMGAEETPMSKAFGKIYEIAHSLSSPKCRKNHPAWVKQIDAAIRAERK